MPRSAYELEGEVRTLDPDPRRGSSFRSSPEVDSRQEITLRDLTVIYRRRQKIIYGVVGAFAILAAIYCIVATRRYESIGIIQVQSKSQDGLGLDTMASGGSDTSPDALAVNMDIQTQVNILQSESLAIKTIEQLHMEGTKDFESRWNPIGWFLGLFSPAGTPDPANASLENSPQRRRRAVYIFENYLKVKATPGTRLINISYTNPDPKLAAAVVNKLTELLIDYSFQTRFDATNQAASWLNSQIGDLRQQSEQLQKQVSDLESKSGIYTIGTVGADGRTQNYSDVLDKLQSATAAVSQAEQNRILRGAILHAAQSGDAEMLSGLAGNTSNGAAMNGSLTVIQNLRGQEATARAALQQAEAKYGPAYPRLQELRGNVAGLDHSIQQEIERLKGRAQSDYDDAVRTEDENRAQYNQLKAQADTLNNKSIDVAIVRQEADQSRGLYDELLKKFKEAGVLEGLKGSTITVVDPGRVPGKPDRPNIPLYMAIAILGGFFLGCCGALLVESMDEKINTVSEVERISGDHLLGATPVFFSLGSSNGSSAGYDGAPQLASISDPQSPFIEAARSIRTEILLLGGARKASQVILVTSSVPGEGKTVLSANLAVLLAQSGKKVLLIDADLRLGALQTTLNLPAGTGLSELLSGAVDKPQICAVPGVPKLDALQVGAAPDNPSELLGSGVLAAWLTAWREKYDYIVLDSAPLLPVTDSLTLAPLSDITLLVARPGLTEKSQLIRSYQLLTRRSSGFVAAIVNGLQPGEEGYSSYFGYRKPENSYGAIVKARK